MDQIGPNVGHRLKAKFDSFTAIGQKQPAAEEAEN
jgi:hypothetical protein